MKTCSFQGFAGFFYLFFGQAVAVDLISTVIVAKGALIFTISGEINETVKKHPVAKIVIPYLSRCVIKLLKFFFGFKGKKSLQVTVR